MWLDDMLKIEIKVYQTGLGHGRDGIKFYPPSDWPIRSLGGRFDDIYKRGYEAGQRESWNPRIREIAKQQEKSQ